MPLSADGRAAMARVIAELHGAKGIPLKQCAALVDLSYKTTWEIGRRAVPRATLPHVVTRISRGGKARVVRT